MYFPEYFRQTKLSQLSFAQVDLNEAIFFICSTNKEKVRTSREVYTRYTRTLFPVIN